MKKQPQIVLNGWQEHVVDVIKLHPVERESEAYQGLPDYVINKQLSVTVAFPKGAGHTTFANWLASKYPAVVIYSDLKHYVKLSEQFELHKDTDMLSMFEIYYAIHNNDGTQPSTQSLEDIKARFAGKEVVVIDNAESVPATIRNFIYSVSPTIVVNLGK